MSKRKRTVNKQPPSTTTPSTSQILSSQTCSLIGKIKSVCCKDFVTYRECTFYPTEYLNVIIGPNGTGKSTLVAAIVLCLGGEPKLLQRASSIADYIKNGRESATVNVEIYTNNDDKTVIFTRSFDKNEKSVFKINEDTVSKKKYIDEISIYKIQINNLCQFLPQDRVQDFAKMNAQEKLLNTLKSVCSIDVIDNFNKLKELRNNQLTSKKTHEIDLQKLNESKMRLEELEQQLSRYNERNEYMKKLDVCNIKKQWLDIESIKLKDDELVIDLLQAQKKFQERQKSYNILLKKQAEITKTITTLTDDAIKKEQKLQDFLNNKSGISARVDDFKKKIRMAKTDLEKAKRDLSDRKTELQNETRILEVIAQDLKNKKDEIGTEAEQKAKLSAYEEESQQLKNEILKFVSDRSNINKKLDEEYTPEIQMLRRRIEQSENVAEQKLQLIRSKFPDLYTAVQWLNHNKNLFEGMVYKPMILELNVRDSNHAKYFENTIPLRDMLAFTCERKLDVSILVKELCTKQKLSVNVVHSEAADDCQYSSNEPITNLRKYGFLAYLIDLIEGPPSILNYLCSLHNLHRIPIDTEQVNRFTDSIPANIRQYFRGDNRYIVSISKYSGEPSTMQINIVGKNMLSSRNAQEIQKLERRLNELVSKSDSLKNKRSHIEAKINEIEYQRKDIMKSKRSLESISLDLNGLMEQSKRQNQKVNLLSKNVIDVPKMENNFRNTVIKYLKNIIDLEEEKIKILKCYHRSSVDKKFAKTKVLIYRQQNEGFLNNIKEADDNQKEAKRLLDVISNSLDMNRRKYKSKISEYYSSTNNCKPSDANFPYKDTFNELPDNMEELKSFINEYSARIDCMGDVDQKIVEEHEARSSDVKTLKESIEGNKNAFENIAANIESIYREWYKEVNRVIDILNSCFGKFMESISYVGEIVLIKQNEYDFDTYGIDIMVQYRNDVPLRPLNSQVQSGGERAVAIAVYMLSLQHLTHVPFRCVDEINQGMDSKNERKIFEMLTKETTQTGRAQFFFVTPKLLPNLIYNDKMSIHVVFNGKMVQSKDAFSFNL